MFAIIIGIDEYKSEPLSGACADADDFNKLLVETFGVDPEKIINLRNNGSDKKHPDHGPATYSNIIAKIQSLKDNRSIRKGDPIVIYFSGHGARSRSEDLDSESLSMNCAPFIESICPVDIDSCDASENTVITAIPDFTIRGLLNELSQEKGNNIVCTQLPPK